jgi:hypothetical protein
MSKRILSLVFVVIMIASLFAGCGSKSATSSNEAMMDKAVAPAADVQVGKSEAEFTSVDQAVDGKNGSAAQEAPKASEAKEKSGSSSITGSGTEADSVQNAILAQRKIIRNANISVEVDDFDKSYGQIKSMINTYGFIQESNVKKQKDYKGNPITSGIIVIRVDRDKFDEVISGIKGLGDLIDESIKSDDVTDKFFDTESRLRLLRFEEGRLEEYLKKISDPDTIFKTESRLTDIRHEIESLTGTLKKWNDLVALSTITINIYEKSAAVNNIPVVKTYGNRLSDSFSGSMKGVVNFFGEFLIFAVGALPVLVVLVILGWFGYRVYRKASENKILKAKENIKEDNDLQ